MTPTALTSPLGLYPTPLHPLDRLSEAVGGRTRIWVKRDDQTGLALGGNKVRKLEFLLADAQLVGATAIVTWGGRQSNHCRQTAAAAARQGLRCILVLDRGALDDQEYQQSGNVLLDRLFGAELIDLEPDADAAERAARVVAELTDQGETPYLIPVGGSTAIGALGYVRCAEEILAAGESFSSLFLATGSGGTQAGLLAGLRSHGSGLRVTGVSVAASAELQRAKVSELAGRTADLLGADEGKRPSLDDVVVDDRQVGPGYGRPTPEMHEALHLVARTEGMLLDPVYSGKAMAGLLHAARQPDATTSLGPDVLFLHTGGQPGLFAYRRPLVE